MQVHLHLAFTHPQTLLNICITESLHIPHHDDAAKRIVQGLDCKLQLLPEKLLVNLADFVRTAGLLIDIGVMVEICLRRSLLAYVVDHRVMGDPHQPGS